MIDAQGVFGDETVGCGCGGTLAQGFRPPDDLIPGDFVQDLDAGERECNRSQAEEDEDEKEEFKPDSAEHGGTRDVLRS